MYLTAYVCVYIVIQDSGLFIDRYLEVRSGIRILFVKFSTLLLTVI